MIYSVCWRHSLSIRGHFFSRGDLASSLSCSRGVQSVVGVGEGYEIVPSRFLPVCIHMGFFQYPNKAVKFSTGVSEEHLMAWSSRSTHGMNVPVGLSVKSSWERTDSHHAMPKPTCMSPDQ